MTRRAPTSTETRPVRIPGPDFTLEGDLGAPAGARGVVLFAHGSGSSRMSPRNRFVAGELRSGGIGTLLIDLLTAQEEEYDTMTAQLRFDIPLLTDRLVAATDWLLRDDETRDLGVGYFGASTGSAAALVASTKRPDAVEAVVSRGGRPDLAADALADVKAPTLLIVGGDDPVVIDLNREAMQLMTCEKSLIIVPGATHLFEEPGALEKVADLALGWFQRYLSPRA